MLPAYRVVRLVKQHVQMRFARFVSLYYEHEPQAGRGLAEPFHEPLKLCDQRFALLFEPIIRFKPIPLEPLLRYGYSSEISAVVMALHGTRQGDEPCSGGNATLSAGAAPPKGRSSPKAGWTLAATNRNIRVHDTAVIPRPCFGLMPDPAVPWRKVRSGPLRFVGKLAQPRERLIRHSGQRDHDRRIARTREVGMIATRDQRSIAMLRGPTS